MIVKEILLNGKKYYGFEGEISPGSSLVFIKGNIGFIMCGYLSLETAEKMNNVAAIVRGVNTIADMLKRNVEISTINAQKIGIIPGISVIKAIEKIN
ncbi:MAG: DUF1805 domain-containing protein [Endomicrobium sp.]|jgi:uncharacterized protein YunC (DUF1805 family)|nr:DUF1805 domain-containing protein [Endomicrobium sp.]